MVCSPAFRPPRLRLSGLGGHIVLWDINPDRFDATLNDFRPEAILSVDVAEPTSVDGGFRQTLDVLVPRRHIWVMS